MKKITPRLLAQFVGLGAGAFFGGPLLASLGGQCGAFIGDLLGDEDEGGWGLADATGSLLQNLFANKLQEAFENAPSDFNHDLRRAAAQALVDALAWERRPGPFAAALLKTPGFQGMSAQRQDMLRRFIQRWQFHIATTLAQAEKAKDACLLDSILPPTSDIALIQLSDSFLNADEATAQAWAAFYQQTLQPVIDGIVNEDERRIFDHATLRRDSIDSFATTFPGCFAQVLKDLNHRPAWIAFQKTLLQATQRAIHDIGAQTQRLPEIERKIDLLVENDKASAALGQSITTFLDTAQTKLDGTYANTQEIKILITNSRTSLETLLTDIQRGVTQANEKLDELLKRKPLNQYLQNLTSRFSKHITIGLPAVEDTQQKQGPDGIEQLFVQPTCTAERLRPEDLPAALQQEQKRPAALLQQLRKHRRIVLLADPGMGKSTLIQWLIVTHASPLPSAQAIPGGAIPLPMILRDIVPLMPKDLSRWSWQELIKAFLKHQHDEHKPGMAQPLANDEDTLRDVLASPQAWFLIDGLDEVGGKDKRLALRKAIWQGFETSPQARFLVTSRVIGYEEAEVHAKPPDISSHEDAHRLLREKGLAPERLSNDEMLAALFTYQPFHLVSTLLYLAPWDNTQQSAFSENWFQLRLGEDAGPIRAREFVRAVHDHPSTSSIGRVPNLLLLMALLFRHRADLPHGRAKVYAGISQAYLENIATVLRIDHRTQTSHPFTLAQKERLLAIIAMHMQLRRSEDNDEDEQEILAPSTTWRPGSAQSLVRSRTSAVWRSWRSSSTTSLTAPACCCRAGSSTGRSTSPSPTCPFRSISPPAGWSRSSAAY